MAKQFFTERDIVDLVNRGVTSLEVSDDIVLTDLAREMAMRHNLRLVRTKAAQPETLPQAEVIRRVKAAVIARLGDGIDPALLDAVIIKVINGMK